MEKKQNKKQGRSKKKGRRNSVPLISLSADEVRRMIKPHSGFESFAPELIALYDAKKDELNISGVDGGAVTDALEKSSSLRAVEVVALEQLALVQGTRFYYSSTAYSLLLEIYARCQRAARTNPAIKRAISGFEQFLKPSVTRKSAAEPATPPPSTTTTPSTTATTS